MSNQNEILGRITCQNGGRGVVMQTKRKGRHLYTRCDCCGLDQRTGAAVQQWIWDKAEWLGEIPQPPTNVNQDGEAKAQPKPEPETAPDFDPETDIKPDEQTGKQTKKKPKGYAALGVAVLGMVGIAAAIIRA